MLKFGERRNWTQIITGKATTENKTKKQKDPIRTEKINVEPLWNEATKDGLNPEH